MIFSAGYPLTVHRQQVSLHRVVEKGRSQKMFERETRYVGQYQPLHVQVLGNTRAQQAHNPLNCLENIGEGRDLSLTQRLVGWGGRDRTCECRYQKPVPYHLATPHQESGGP